MVPSHGSRFLQCHCKSHGRPDRVRQRAETRAGHRQIVGTCWTAAGNSFFTCVMTCNGATAKRCAPRISNIPGSACSIPRPARNTPISCSISSTRQVRRGKTQRSVGGRRASARRPHAGRHFAHPASYFLAITTFEVTYPQRQDIVEKFENRWTEPSNIVTNGPFRLALGNNENEIELSANSNYFRGKPAIDKVSMFMVNEKTTAVTMYEQGNLDFMERSTASRRWTNRAYRKCPAISLCPSCAANITASRSTVNLSTIRNCASLRHGYRSRGLP